MPVSSNKRKNGKTPSRSLSRDEHRAEVRRQSRMKRTVVLGVVVALVLGVLALVGVVNKDDSDDSNEARNNEAGKIAVDVPQGGESTPSGTEASSETPTASASPTYIPAPGERVAPTGFPRGATVAGGKLVLDAGKLAPASSVISAFIPASVANAWSTVTRLSVSNTGLATSKYKPSPGVLVVGYTASPREKDRLWAYDERTYLVTASHDAASREATNLTKAKSAASTYLVSVTGNVVVVTSAADDPNTTFSGARLDSRPDYQNSIKGLKFGGTSSALWVDVNGYFSALALDGAPKAKALFSQYLDAVVGKSSYWAGTTANDASQWEGKWIGFPGKAAVNSAPVSRVKAALQGAQPTCTGEQCDSGNLELNPEQKIAYGTLSNLILKESKNNTVTLFASPSDIFRVFAPGATVGINTTIAANVGSDGNVLISFTPIQG